MKNLKSQIKQGIIKRFNKGNKLFKIIASSFILLITISASTTSTAQVSVGVGVNIRLPFWAPTYANVDRVRYYYLPDIECYFDVWNQEFVYLQDGNWMFASQLPQSYAGYDFNANPFVVVLDWNVHEPWMHFHYYVAHYPKFYYRTVYKNEGRAFVGFNENERGIVYERNKDAKYKMETRREPISREQRVEQTRPAQQMKYYGNTVGQPVKVEKQMLRPGERGRR